MTAQRDIPIALPDRDERAYSRAELASDMAVHLAALVMALAAVPVLIGSLAI